MQKEKEKYNSKQSRQIRLVNQVDDWERYKYIILCEDCKIYCDEGRTEVLEFIKAHKNHSTFLVASSE